MSNSNVDIQVEAAKTWDVGRQLGLWSTECEAATCGKIESLIRKETSAAKKGKAKAKKSRRSNKLSK